jgi:glycine/D-amino acid oxidase-like deaminating enzyme
MSDFDRTVDVLIVGSGAAGLVAALTADDEGLSTLVVEKSDKIGGASAYSGGGLWIPDNHVIKAAGVRDSFEEALTYMETVIEDVGPASSRERKIAFLRNGPRWWRSWSGWGSSGCPVWGTPTTTPTSRAARPRAAASRARCSTSSAWARGASTCCSTR